VKKLKAPLPLVAHSKGAKMKKETKKMEKKESKKHEKKEAKKFEKKEHKKMK